MFFFCFLMWVLMDILVSTHEDLSLKIPVGTHWPMGFWLTALGDLWERIFTDPGVTFGAQNTHGYRSRSPVSALVLSLTHVNLGHPPQHPPMLKLMSANGTDNGGLYTPPPFPVGLHRTWPIQNAKFLALEWLELSGDFPVTFRCMFIGLVSPMDFPPDCPSDFHQTSSQIPPEMTGQQRKVRWKSGGLQRTPSRQPSLLVLLRKNINWINNPNNTLNQIVHY